MFVVLYLSCFILFLLLAKRKFCRWVNIISLFTGLWCLTGAISTVGFFYLRIPSAEVHIYSLLFVCVFNIVFLVRAKRGKTFIIRNNTSNSDVDHYINVSSRGVDSIQIIAISLSLVLIVKMTNVILTQHSLTAVRDVYFGSGSFSSVYLDLIFRIIPIGMLYGLIVFNVYSSIKYGNRKFFIWAIVDTAIITLTGGGRYGLLLLIYSIVMIYICEPINEDKTSYSLSKYNKLLTRVVVITVIIIIFITILRGQILLKSIVTYFAGSFSFLDYILSNPSAFELDNKLYGYLFFGGIIEPFVLLLKILGMTNLKVPQWYFNIYCQQFYRITTAGTAIYINNNTTILYHLLRDFGVFGIVAGAILLAVILSFLYNRLDRENDFNKLCYIYFANILFNSVMTYQFFGTNPFFVILTLFICSRNRRIKFVIGTRNTRS